MSKVPDELRFLYRDGRLLPFIGAGVSMSVQWIDGDGKERHGPSWGELVEQAARQLHFEEPGLLSHRGDALQILEYFKIKKGTLAPLTNWLYRELHPPDADLRAAKIHGELAKLCAKCRVLYTTNYDDFLERALRLAGHDCSGSA